MIELIDKKCLYYSIIASAIPVVVLAVISKDLIYVAVLVASVASGIAAAIVYTGELLNAKDKVSVTATLGYGIGYLIGISVAALIYAFRGIRELAAFANTGFQGGYLALLIISIFISYVTGIIAFDRMVKRKVITRRVKTRKHRRR